MINYFNEIRHGKITYSVDKIIIDFYMNYLNGKHTTQSFLDYLSFSLDLNYKHWETTQIGCFKHQFSVECDNDDSYWIGVCFNSIKLENDRIRIEFNPNKVAASKSFQDVHSKLRSLSKSIMIKRFDLAVDYPVLRENVYMLKDRRKYSEYRNSFKDRTQYLGVHSHHGYIKIYNKQLESDLNYPLTRLEITIDYEKNDYENLKSILPKVVVLDDLQLTFSEYSFRGSDRFDVESVLDNPSRLELLPYRKRKKIECIIAQYTQSLSINGHVYNEILSQVRSFCQ